MPNPEKATTIEEIKEKLNSAKIAILTDFQGLNVAEVTELRKLFRTANIDYKVYKNTLTRLAAEQLGVTGVDKYLVGPTALAFGKSDDLAAPAKIVKDFSAKHQRFKVKAGILNKKAISSEDVIALINMPSREMLIAMVLGGIQSPVSKLLGVLQGPMRNFIGVLKSLADKAGNAGTESSDEQDNKNVSESTSDQ